MFGKSVIIDACSLINFYASGFLESILESFNTQSCIAEQVEQESLFVRKLTDSTSKYNYEPIHLRPFVESGLLSLVKLDTDVEKDLFMKLAESLDDGEAASMTIAISRDLDIVTDDKKAIQTVRKEAPHTVILTTLDILKNWSESVSIQDEDIRIAIENIRIGANYYPSKKHHLFQWWQSFEIFP